MGRLLVPGGGRRFRSRSGPDGVGWCCRRSARGLHPGGPVIKDQAAHFAAQLVEQPAGRFYREISVVTANSMMVTLRWQRHRRDAGSDGIAEAVERVRTSSRPYAWLLPEPPPCEAAKWRRPCKRSKPRINDVEILNNFGYAYLRYDNPGAAEAWLLLTLVLAPERVNAWVNLGEAYAEQGQADMAVACLANGYRFSKNQTATRAFMQKLADDLDQDPAVRSAVQRTLQLPIMQAGKS